MPLLKYPFKAYLFHYGIKAGLPFRLLRAVLEAYDIGRRPRDVLNRRRLATEILRDSPWRGFLPRVAGHRRFGAGEMPGFDRLVEVGRALYAEHARADPDRLVRPENNPFAPLLGATDFAAQPALLEVALSRPMVDILSDYFGAVPCLDNVDIWVTRPNLESAGGFSSQLFHLDKPERSYVTAFVNLFDVAPENGPLAYLPAAETATVRRRTRYDRLYYLSHGRLDDEEVFRVVDPAALVTLDGPAGAGAFVDTSTCLHSGSRCEAGERVLMVLTYMPAHKAGTHRRSAFAAWPGARDRLARLLLDEVAEHG